MMSSLLTYSDTTVDKMGEPEMPVRPLSDPRPAISRGTSCVSPRITLHQDRGGDSK